MNVVNFFILLIVGAILAVVGVLIFANVDSAVVNLIPLTPTHVTNETVTITMMTGSDNSTLLAQSGFDDGTESVKNSTNCAITLDDGSEYNIINTVGDGELTNRANFTLLNVSYNNTAIHVSYTYNAESDAYTTSDTIEDTVLDSFELGTIAFIVLAAAVILSAVMFFSKGK